MHKEFLCFSCVWRKPSWCSNLFCQPGQHWLQHQGDHPEELSPAHLELLWSSPAAGLQPDEKGLVPQVPPLWHLSAPHPEERPQGHHVPQKVTFLRFQRERRGHERTLGLVTLPTLCQAAGSTPGDFHSYSWNAKYVANMLQKWKKKNIPMGFTTAEHAEGSFRSTRGEAWELPTQHHGSLPVYKMWRHHLTFLKKSTLVYPHIKKYHNIFTVYWCKQQLSSLCSSAHGIKTRGNKEPDPETI